MRVNKKVLKRQLENLSLEKSFGKFGEEIKSFVNENGFQVIENLSGHEISKFELHSGKHIPNYNNNDLDKFEEGKIYAIEPFITQGDNKIKEKGKSNILILENKIKNTRDIIAKKVLNVIREKFSKMPFSKRWLLEFFERRKVLYALEILKKEGIVFEYGKLVSNNEKPISQFEQSVVFFQF